MDENGLRFDESSGSRSKSKVKGVLIMGILIYITNMSYIANHATRNGFIISTC
jgi:hypothetical protein